MSLLKISNSNQKTNIRFEFYAKNWPKLDVILVILTPIFNFYSPSIERTSSGPWGRFWPIRVPDFDYLQPYVENKKN